MQEPSFEQLAADAAAGLHADRELFLDVKQELYTHLEEKASSFTRQGKSEAESVELARKAFGSPLDVAAELLDANRRKMKLRSLLRVTFGALIVPLAILLALYVEYGRFARSQELMVKTSLITYAPDRWPTVPLFKPPALPAAAEVHQLKGSTDNVENLRRYWESHRRQADGYIYYAYYAIYLDSSDGPAYVRAMRFGEKIEPHNALYNVLLAEYYLGHGLEKATDGTAVSYGPTYRVSDRQAFESGIAEYRAAAQKPYLREYVNTILRKKLSTLPHLVYAEDEILPLQVKNETDNPLRYKAGIAHQIIACACILIAEKRTAEAMTVMDLWQPYIKLLVTDTDASQVNMSIAMAYGVIGSRESVAVYTRLGALHKAQQARILAGRFERVHEIFQAEHNEAQKKQLEMQLHDHADLDSALILPSLENRINEAALQPGRMADHVKNEERLVQLVLILLALALIATLLQGAFWLYHLRGSSAIPLLLMPKAWTIMRALLLGILLPLLIYWCYSRLPVIGGREYGWLSSMQPRFIAELLILGFLLLWLPAQLLRKGIRQRCEDLGLVVPNKKEELIIRIMHTVIVTVCLLTLTISSFPVFLTPSLITIGGYLPANSLPSPIIITGVILIIGLCIVAIRYTHKKRQLYGLYYGTVARSLAPVYAFSMLLLSLTAQPWLLYNEVHWVQQDTLKQAYLLNPAAETADYSQAEAQASRLAKQLQQALEGDEHSR